LHVRADECMHRDFNHHLGDMYDANKADQFPTKMGEEMEAAAEDGYGTTTMQRAPRMRRSVSSVGNVQPGTPLSASPHVVAEEEERQHMQAK